MKKSLLLTICAAAFMSFTVNASAQDIMAELTEGCGTEMEQFCNGVTLGEGRLAACFYAYEDQLSNQCQYTLYEIASKLQAAVVVLNYFVEQCGADVEKLCPGVEPGEGRIANCLTSQSSALSASCTAAIENITAE